MPGTEKPLTNILTAECQTWQQGGFSSRQEWQQWVHDSKPADDAGDATVQAMGQLSVRPAGRGVRDAR
jgi:hypothetical protein